jgi:hypothetical protein
MTERNDEMQMTWSVAEEQLISETMAADGLARIEAVHRLRRSWRVGGDRPPGWPERRKMPESNPRYGQAVEENRLECPATAGLLHAEASTPTFAGSEMGRLPKPASIRQARWRRKRRLAKAA